MEVAAGVEAGGFQGEPLLAGTEDIGQGGLTVFLQLIEAVFEGLGLGQELGGGFLMNGGECFHFIERGGGFGAEAGGRGAGLERAAFRGGHGFG